eukprot:TRINITY_DN6126_c0_g1_i2.p1 TRINITY_DN6126_c0_g1~~TRINITY_DN6126_c0_g1_i2.p1  ORF type:complete len:466 (-),score=88.45 TRINITY_DN6126_c0_g1_i2:6-1382(-)
MTSCENSTQVMEMSALENALYDDSFEEFINLLRTSTDDIVQAVNDRGHNLVHLAALYGLDDYLQLLIEHHVDIDLYDPNHNTPLHFAVTSGWIECAELLINAGCNLYATTNDFRLSISSIPIYVTGGRNALHLAAEKNEPEIIKLLIDAGIDTSILDNDGKTALHIARISGKRKNVILIDPECTLPEISQEDRIRIKREEFIERRTRIDTLEKLKKEEEIRNIQMSYVSLYPNLFVFDMSMCQTSFSQALSKGPDGIASIVNEVHTGVYTFDMLSEQFCSMLIEEINNFENSGLPIQRPNSMNNYGVILDHFGFTKMISTLIKTCILPLSSLLFPDSYGKTLDNHHSFIVKYKIGEDLDLAEHADSSHVTLNVCLGKQFSGGSLYFKGIRGTPTEQTQYTEVSHRVGTGILHVGKHIHAALPITEGERINLIIWCRSDTSSDTLPSNSNYGEYLSRKV